MLEIMNKIKHNIKTLFLGLALIASASAYAQSDSLEMDVTFTGTTVLTLSDAFKISTWPEERVSIVEIPPIKYSLIPNKLSVNIEPKLIKPAKINIEEKLKKLYRGYVRAGFGLYSTPLAELYYMDGRSRNGTFSIHAKHLSSSGEMAFADSIPDGFSDNEVHLWGKRFIKKHALEGGFDWERNMMHYHGFNPEINTDASIDNLKQFYNNIDGFVNLTSFFRDSSKVNYQGELKFYNYSDNFKGVENSIDFSAHGRRYLNSELFSVDLDIDYFDFKYFDRQEDEQNNYDNVIIGLTPQASTSHDKWRVAVGMGLYIDSRSGSPFHFYPLAEAKYSLIDDLFIPYVGVGGALEKTSFKTITQDNPFVVTDPELKSQNKKIDVYGGIRGTISSNVSFNAKISQTKWEDYIYFFNDSTSSNTTTSPTGNQFLPWYDDLSITQLTGEVSINTTDVLKFFLRGDFYLYTTGLEDEAWNQPTTRFTFNGIYNLADKFNISMEIYTEGKRKAKSLVPVEGLDAQTDGSYTIDLKGYADVNLGIEYRYTKRLSAFVRLNNMFAAKYERWHNYRSQRFNAMMGVSYSF